MELLDIFIWCGFFTEVYDSNKTYNNDENVNLLFTYRLPINGNFLPFSVLDKMYEGVDFNKELNVRLFNDTFNYIKNLKDYKIFIDNWGNFRRIMIYVNGKTRYIANMIF